MGGAYRRLLPVRRYTTLTERRAHRGFVERIVATFGTRRSAYVFSEHTDFFFFFKRGTRNGISLVHRYHLTWLRVSSFRDRFPHYACTAAQLAHFHSDEVGIKKKITTIIRHRHPFKLQTLWKRIKRLVSSSVLAKHNNTPISLWKSL